VSEPRKVRCPDCKSEGRESPGIVGELFELRGRLAWHGFDRHSAKTWRSSPTTGSPSLPERGTSGWRTLQQPPSHYAAGAADTER